MQEVVRGSCTASSKLLPADRGPSGPLYECGTVLYYSSFKRIEISISKLYTLDNMNLKYNVLRTSLHSRLSFMQFIKKRAVARHGISLYFPGMVSSKFLHTPPARSTSGWVTAIRPRSIKSLNSYLPVNNFKNAANLEKLFFQVICEYNMKLPFHSIVN